MMANSPAPKEQKIDENWWPAPIAHVRDLDPWADNDVVVAEIQSFADGAHTGHRHSFSALVPLADLEEVKTNLAKFEYGVQTSGPRPSASPEYAYTPKFWIENGGPPVRAFEPMVLSWGSHDKTVLQLDPGFAMTYGLAPRSVGDGETRWDDPAAPLYDVASVSAPSVWNFPSGTTARVTVKKDYLQDYLSLRQMALVHTYWEMRWGPTDDAIEAKVGSAEGVDFDLSDRRYALRRSWEDKKIVSAQVWGARVIALPGPFPISENPLEKEGLMWPGFKEPVTDDKAMQMGVTDLVYVKDTVLGGYEGRSEFRINPKSGSVTFGTQWSVSFCDRVGRDLISLELKKLYEGVPSHITREWHRCAVPPPSESALDRMASERNVGIRAEEIVFAVVSLGETLCQLAEALSLPGLEAEDFVGLRRKAIEYHGWWTLENIEPVARYIPLGLTEDAFLTRCMNLNKLVSESLSEKSLRLVLRALGVPAEAVEGLRSLKLLDCLVRMAQLAEKAGLELAMQGQEVWLRLEKDGTQPAQPIERLFALTELRNLAGHRSGGRRERLAKELKRFGLSLSGAGAGHGLILDQVYDSVIRDVEGARSKVDAALAICNPLVTVSESPNAERALRESRMQKSTGGKHRRLRRRGRRGGRRNRKEKSQP